MLRLQIDFFMCHQIGYFIFRILKVHVKNLEGKDLEEPFEVTLKVLDKNDNPPIFTKQQFEVYIRERSSIGKFFRFENND